MDKLNGRKINRNALEEIRIRAAKHVAAGESPEIVIKDLETVSVLSNAEEG